MKIYCQNIKLLFRAHIRFDFYFVRSVGHIRNSSKIIAEWHVGRHVQKSIKHFYFVVFFHVHCPVGLKRRSLQYERVLCKDETCNKLIEFKINRCNGCYCCGADNGLSCSTGYFKCTCRQRIDCIH